MNLAYESNESNRALGLILVPCAVLAIALTAGSSHATPTRLKIKNGRNITVALDGSRERAVGIKPENEIWTLMLVGDLAGSTADLQDVTPNVTRSRWTIPVETDRLALDQPRFLPSHVYRIEIRKEKQLLGTAFVYLYPPPPPPEVNHVELGGEKENDQPKSSSPHQIPKGGL